LAGPEDLVTQAATTPAEAPPQGRYPHYVLGVLVLVYVLNFVDRQILSILNEEIKRDLGLSDSEMGFLFGTAFAVFYALFGIPLGKLADVWTRRTLIAVSLAFWSAATAVSGLARNFGELAAARVAVGIGEAGATPAAFSLLTDFYPAARRATVLALYSSGIYLGAGLGLTIGGQIVGRWDAAFPDATAPFGLAGWQVAFFVVGLPGLLLALWVRTLREPVRGAMDALPVAPEPHPFRLFGRELAAVLPPATLWSLWNSGAGARGLAVNGATAALLAVAAAALSVATNDPKQWIALGVGLYAALSWAQGLRHRDPASAALILNTSTLRWGGIGFAFLAFTGYGVGHWTTVFFLRVHEIPIDQAGLLLGGIAAAGGFLGVAIGGIAADAWRRRDRRGRLYFALASTLVPVPLLIGLVTTGSTSLALALNFPLAMAGSMWIGVGASTVQDLVLPRMRATASAAYLLVVTFIGLAMGPYTIGKLSDVFDLRTALLLGLCANGVAFICIAMASRHLVRDEATLVERAAHAGSEAI
jgi:MFS family permease